MHGMNYNFQSNFCVEMDAKRTQTGFKPEADTPHPSHTRRHSRGCVDRSAPLNFRIGTGTLANALDVQLCLRKPGRHTRISERMTRKLMWYELYNIMGQNIILSTIV